MNNTFALVISICFVLVGCQKNEAETPAVQYQPVLSFDDFEVGDEFYYEFFTAEDYFDENNSNYEIHLDTLVLEVCNIDDEGRYVISESLTEESASLILSNPN